LRNPITGTEQRDVPAQLDSAADRSVLPDALVQSLSLPQIESILIGGVGGDHANDALLPRAGSDSHIACSTH